MKMTQAQILTQLLDPAAVALAMGGTPEARIHAGCSVIMWRFPDGSTWEAPVSHLGDFNSFGGLPDWAQLYDYQRFYNFCCIKQMALKIRDGLGTAHHLVQLAIKAGGHQVESRKGFDRICMPDGSIISVETEGVPRWTIL